MRLAVVSDVHADADALRAALARARELDCETVVCLGDLVDFGTRPDETVALLQKHEVPTIRGNHDRWALDDVGRTDLSDSTRCYLAELPTSWAAEVHGTRIVAWHARPRSDMDGVYPDQLDDDAARRLLDEAGADVLLVGHTHEPFALTTSDGRLVGNPGALLRTTSATPAMLLNPDTGRFELMPPQEGGTFGVLNVKQRRFSIKSVARPAPIVTPG